MEAERIRRGNSNTHADEKNEKAELRKKKEGLTEVWYFSIFWLTEVRGKCKKEWGMLGGKAAGVEIGVSG